MISVTLHLNPKDVETGCLEQIIKVKGEKFLDDPENKKKLMNGLKK